MNVQWWTDKDTVQINLHARAESICKNRPADMLITVSGVQFID